MKVDLVTHQELDKKLEKFKNEIIAEINSNTTQIVSSVIAEVMVVIGQHLQRIEAKLDASIARIDNHERRLTHLEQRTA